MPLSTHTHAKTDALRAGEARSVQGAGDAVLDQQCPEVATGAWSGGKCGEKVVIVAAGVGQEGRAFSEMPPALDGDFGRSGLDEG